MKKICFFLIIFLYQTFSYAKTSENIEFNHKYLSNYFSAIISINNQDDKDSLKYLNNTKSLVRIHESYLENYLISLVLNNKIDIAFNKAIQLKANETNFFEAKISEIYLLNFFFFTYLKIRVQPLFVSKFHCGILSKEVRLLSEGNLRRIFGRSDSRDKMGGSHPLLL